MQLSRRDFFRFGLGESVREAACTGAGAAAGPAPTQAFLRPPGALPEREFLAACTRCDACLIACPRESIRRAGHELGPHNEGTPVILPGEQPCWLCADLPCIPVCEPGALRPLAEARDARLGTIRINPARCFSAQGNPCDVCAERCPVRPRAVRVGFGQPPELDPALCTGCAVCAWLCPAQAIACTGPAPAG